MGFYIYGKFIAYYGFCIALGIFCAAIVGYFLCKKLNFNINDFIIATGILTLFSILGAKILYILISFRYIEISNLTNLKYLSFIMGSGFVFYGGLIGGIISIFFIKKYFNIDIKNYIPIVSTLAPLIHTFGRVGCYLVGCCHGIVFNSRFSRVYSNSFFAPNNLPLFPVQLVESFFNFLIFLILLFYLLRNKSKENKKSLEIYLILYSVLRFILEFYRGDYLRGKFFFFSTSQLISICIIVIIGFKFLFCAKNGGNYGK